MAKYNIIRASCRGPAVDHIYQDYLKVVDNDLCLMAVVADGLGSARLSSRGSEMICQILSEIAETINWEIYRLPEVLNTAISEWYRRVEIKELISKECATTCSAVFIDKHKQIAYLCQIGDSPIFYRKDSGIVHSITQEKEFLNETICIGSTNRPHFDIQIVQFLKTFEFLVSSDGFGDEVVMDTVGGLFDYFIHKYNKIKPAKRDRTLKIEILNTVQKKNNDDKSIVFGWICQ